MIIQPPQQGRRGSPDGGSVQDAAADVGVILPDVAMLALQQGRMIEAIKLIRSANPGLDLTRAKAALERLQAQAKAQVHGKAVAPDDGDDGDAPVRVVSSGPSRRPPTVEMGDPPGQLRWLLVVVVLLSAAVWMLFGGGA